MLRRIIVYDSVKNVKKAGISPSKSSPKDPKLKTASVPRKQNNKFPQKFKTFLKKLTGQGFKTIHWVNWKTFLNLKYDK